ncbi:MAG: RimK family alpha-L-glutamate ligase [Planctomycetota bacterium]|nr:RimK family alpha-L-glutamate ligase [Planctomycetota bacterium]
MRIGVLGNSGSWYCGDIERAAAARGHECSRLEFRRIAGVCGFQQPLLNGAVLDETRLDEFDAILIRTMPPGSLEEVVFRMDLLARLEAGGVRVVNSPKSIECAVDKFLTTAKLEAAGLRVPRTVVCQDSDSAMAAFAQLGEDVVVKPLFGSEGRGICRVSDPDLAFRTFRTLERIDAVLYLQEFIPHAGFDTRVLVLGGRILGGMRRFGDGDFRTNVARSARSERHLPTDQECELALRAAAATGSVFGGIDLLSAATSEAADSAGPYVIEVNGVPGWRAFNRVNQHDTADALVQFLET